MWSSEMRIVRGASVAAALALSFLAFGAEGQTTTPAAAPTPEMASGPVPGVPAVAFPRRPPQVQAMALTSTSWKDGDVIPVKYTQPGHDVSPAFAWSNVPDGTESFVLIAHDLDSIAVSGSSNFLHWMVWNIPKTARALPEGLPAEDHLADGTRQISSSGPYYKGPAAPASGPAHHYVFELYALSTTIDVPAVGQSPALTRTAVETAMTGMILGKGVFTGLFKRN